MLFIVILVMDLHTEAMTFMLIKIFKLAIQMV